MRYELEHLSQWTRYIAGTYDTIDEAERDCEQRYGMSYVKFMPNEEGVLSAVIYSEEYVVLKLYERETV